MKIVVTGAQGLLGWHTAARIHAANCAAIFKGEQAPYMLTLADRSTFSDPEALAACVAEADAILHFAGINRGSEDEISRGNPAISRALAHAVTTTNSPAHIIYANSTHASTDSVYGRSKREAANILANVAPLTDVILPHIFGECARPDYNNVTATLIDRLWNGGSPTINEGATVELLHAGAAADIFIAGAIDRPTGALTPTGRPTLVVRLWELLRRFHEEYSAGIFPSLEDDFEVNLFNCYRTAGFPAYAPQHLTIRTDARGTLFETSKARTSGQTFVSKTLPGQSRGDHFHLSLVERFLVVSGDAVIRVRRVLTDEIHEFRVSGAEPVAIDMPPLHTHHIFNEGPGDVVTFFWANRIFDPKNPDTYADPVL